MSRLRINTPDEAELTMEHLYLDLERHIAASTPGLCPAVNVYPAASDWDSWCA